MNSEESLTADAQQQQPSETAINTGAGNVSTLPQHSIVDSVYAHVADINKNNDLVKKQAIETLLQNKKSAHNQGSKTIPKNNSFVSECDINSTIHTNDNNTQSVKRVAVNPLTSMSDTSDSSVSDGAVCTCNSDSHTANEAICPLHVYTSVRCMCGDVWIKNNECVCKGLSGPLKLSFVLKEIERRKNIANGDKCECYGSGIAPSGEQCVCQLSKAGTSQDALHQINPSDTVGVDLKNVVSAMDVSTIGPSPEDGHMLHEKINKGESHDNLYNVNGKVATMGEIQAFRYAQMAKSELSRVSSHLVTITRSYKTVVDTQQILIEHLKRVDPSFNLTIPPAASVDEIISNMIPDQSLTPEITELFPDFNVAGISTLDGPLWALPTEQRGDKRPREGSSDEESKSKAKRISRVTDTNAGKIINGRFTFGGRPSQLSSTIERPAHTSTSKSTETAQSQQRQRKPDSNKPKPASSDTQSSTTGVVKIDDDLSENDDINKWEMVSRNTRAAKARNSSKAASQPTIHSNGIDARQHPKAHSSQPVPEQKTPRSSEKNDNRPVKKPPPITLKGVSMASQLDTTLANFRDRYTVRNRGDKVQVFPKFHEDTQLIYSTLYNQEGLQFFSHKPRHHKEYRVVLKGLDPIECDAAGEMIREAVGCAPNRVVLAKTSRSSFFIVNFRADQVNAAMLAGTHYVGYYKVSWEPYKKRRTGPTQCTTCCDFGHGQEYCMCNPHCIICAEPHKFQLCPLKDLPREETGHLRQCYNCIRNKESKTNHSANASDCPARARFIESRARLSAGKNNKNKTTAAATTSKLFNKSPELPRRTPPIYSTTPPQRRARSAQRTGTSFASVVRDTTDNQRIASNLNSKPLEWGEFCRVMAGVCSRVMAAKTSQEQMLIAFELLGFS